jgi:glycosyltransferase involved in cell wall biosynthesis
MTTFHGRLDLPGLPRIISHFPNAPCVSISENQRLPLQEANWLGTVYHGLPEQSLRPSFAPGQYLAFLGRFTADKGPDVAIRIAKSAGLPLKIAAKVPRAEKGYYANTIAPLVDGDQIQLTGEVNDEAKENFLAHAAALVFPIDWPEPFGLVMIEAMACGTPVIAFRRGSVPEVVDDGVTGFIVETEADAVNAIRRLPELDRRRVRSVFEQRFTAKRMAKDYVHHYQQLIQGRSRPRPALAVASQQVAKNAPSFPG